MRTDDVLEVGPIALRVVRQLRRQVLTGQLKEGMELPSVRRLAHISGTGVVTANRALQRAESERWAERYVGRRLRVAKGALRRAQDQLKNEPPVVIVRLDALQTRVGWDSEVSQVSEGFARVFPGCSIRHAYIDSSAGIDPIRHLVRQYDGISAEVGYVISGMPVTVKRFLAEQNVPCVVHGYVEPDIGLPCVYEDMAKVGRVAAQLLLGSGRMVALCCRELVGAEVQIFDGVAQVAQAIGRRALRREHFYNHLPDAIDEFVPMIDRLLSEDDRPAGILAIHPQHAMAAVQIAARRGIRVPADLQIVGLHHHPMYQFTYPEITSIGPPSMTALGEQCAELLARSMGERSNATTRIVVESTLVERGSTFPAPRRSGVGMRNSS